MENCPDNTCGAEFSMQEICDAVSGCRLLSLEIEFSRSQILGHDDHHLTDILPCRKELTKEEYLEVIRQARELGVRKIIIFGTEPLLYQHIMEIIQFIRAQDMEVELVSNGMAITGAAADELLVNGVKGLVNKNNQSLHENGIFCQHPIDMQPLSGRECLRHLFSCIVNSDGSVQSCAGIAFPIGNVRQQRLGDIIRDSEVVQDLKNYRDTIKGPCGECESFGYCYGCRGAAYHITGDYLASDPLCPKNIDRRGEIMFLPIDVFRVIPHKPPMLLIDRLLEISERASVSEMTVRAGMIFLDENGHLDDVAYPEIISQAVAAQEGFRRFGGRNPLIEGFLIGIKNLEILGDCYVGDTLQISLYKKARFGDFGIIDGEVRKGEELIACGEIKVFQRDTSAV